MKKELYDAMIRLCVDSFHDINWEWDGLTTSERIAIGSKEIFHKLHEEASDFLIVKPSKILSNSDSQRKDHFHVVLTLCAPEFEASFPDRVDPVWTTIREDATPVWTVFREPHYAVDKIEWIGSMEFESISLAHQYADNMNREINES